MKVEALLWILILASLALAIVSRKYRRYGLIIVALSVVTIVVVIVVARRNAPPGASAPGLPILQPAQRPARVDFEQLHVEKLDERDPQARTRIAVTELRFDQIRAVSGTESGTVDRVLARLHNDSERFTLTDFAYHLVVQDCRAEICTPVYEQRGLVAATVPANQALDVAIAIRALETRDARAAPPFKFSGMPNITLSPTETRAYQVVGPGTP